MNRTDILRYWHNALNKADLVRGLTPYERARIVAECASREIAERLAARAQNGLVVDERHPIAADD